MQARQQPQRSPGRAVPSPADDAGLPFTDFSSITSETPLELLNLNWRERDLPERERTKHVHRLHPYLGKFIPQLAEIFLEVLAAACRGHAAPGGAVRGAAY